MKVLNEILNTERDYVRDLVTIREVLPRAHAHAHTGCHNGQFTFCACIFCIHLHLTHRRCF